MQFYNSVSFIPGKSTNIYTFTDSDDCTNSSSRAAVTSATSSNRQNNSNTLAQNNLHNQSLLTTTATTSTTSNFTNTTTTSAASHPSLPSQRIITTSSSSGKTSSTSTSTSTSSVALHSLKAAWKSLSSLTFSSSKLPHLERAESSPVPPPNFEYRYTQFPTTLTTSICTTNSVNTSCSTTFKRTKDSSTSSWQQHQRPSLTNPTSFTHCLGKRKNNNSKSDNALQKIGIKLRSGSDQNLHRVCFFPTGAKAHQTPSSNAIFSNVQLSGSSGDSSGSGSSALSALRDGWRQQRSRSLERNHCTRIHSTRSLERNHKFRVQLRPSFPSSPLSRDTPPDHPAPPPPTTKDGGGSRAPPASYSDSGGFNGSGGSLSICSSSSSGSSCGGGMEAGQSGSFINKPPRGWLHPDQQLAEEGICYGVRVSWFSISKFKQFFFTIYVNHYT